MSNKPYVFISYAHLDSADVLPCVDKMKRSGIGLWYDEGIEAGSEWPEFIAEKVMNCTKFVLFVSNAYLNSQNCKRELNFAISRKKDILTIFLEDVTLSPGMEMQLGTYQAIYRSRFENAEAFQSSLCAEAYFNVCRLGEPVNTAPQAQPRGAASNMSKEELGAMFGDFFGGEAAAARSKRTTAAPTPVKKRPLRSRTTAGVLALILGSLGIHKFYLKKIWMGLLYLFFCWTYIPGILGFIEGIIILCSTDEKFEAKYKCRTK